MGLRLKFRMRDAGVLVGPDSGVRRIGSLKEYLVTLLKLKAGRGTPGSVCAVFVRVA